MSMWMSLADLVGILFANLEPVKLEPMSYTLEQTAVNYRTPRTNSGSSQQTQTLPRRGTLPIFPPNF